MSRPLLTIITGPTASGKSALAVDLALRLDAEIISADSRQIYKDIPITTAVPSLEERQGITHHFLEVLPLEEYYSAACFEEEALKICAKKFKEKRNLIVCGGSMLYIDALCGEIDELPTVPSDIRNSLMEKWYSFGNEWLLAQLFEKDRTTYQKIDHKNLKRVFHALEISITAQQPYSSLIGNGKKQRDFDILKISLDGDRQTLFERINSRVIHMMKNGMEEEARKVYPLRHLNSLNTVGFKEMFAWFEGRFSSIEETIAKIQKNTRVYAKKQLTWHRRANDIIWLDFSAPRPKNVSLILDMISRKKF